ncbi:MAG: hypothetical protein H6822_02700 [Planctomycetaceae bacterium]|nr:hypothetical protein [Planctomycetales bacterium]MCB9921060.1 hypothetical protein [Planctomycetaceae bacterium]
MRQRNLFFAATAAALLAVGLYGCSSSSAPTPASSSPSQPAAGGEMDHGSHAGHDESQHNHAEHAGHEHGDQAASEQSPMAKMMETLAKLPEADRASAEKQHFCPVSGEMLGTMGLPIKVESNGQSAWICCDGCKDKFMGDPATYLAKVNKE